MVRNAEEGLVFLCFFALTLLPAILVNFLHILRANSFSLQFFQCLTFAGREVPLMTANQSKFLLPW